MGRVFPTIMRKLTFFAVAMFFPLAILKAQEPVWKARATVEDAQGDKSQTVSPFLLSYGARLPIVLSRSGQCILEIIPKESYKDGKSSGTNDLVEYTIYQPTQLVPNENSFVPMEIFSVTLPVTLGKDIQLLKTVDGTVTVRLSGSEDKE
jgi:hypothetical protein